MSQVYNQKQKVLLLNLETKNNKYNEAECSQKTLQIKKTRKITKKQKHKRLPREFIKSKY